MTNALSAPSSSALENRSCIATPVTMEEAQQSNVTMMTHHCIVLRGRTRSQPSDNIRFLVFSAIDIKCPQDETDAMRVPDLDAQQIGMKIDAIGSMSARTYQLTPYRCPQPGRTDIRQANSAYDHHRSVSTDTIEQKVQVHLPL